jgi:hypothetical protein
MKRIPRRWYIPLAASITVLLVAVLAIVANGTGNRQHSDVVQPEGQPTATAASLALATHPPLEPTYAAMIAERRDPEIMPLPFPDNPDPSLCGIPTPWGPDNQAWLTGIYEEEMVQPEVMLYDSHLRLEILARAAHGSEVEVILYQQNPVTDYYLVKIVGAEQPNEGWVPGPFLSFSPVAGQAAG